MSTAPHYWFEHCNRLVKDWSTELAAALGRPAAEIASRGLGASDFRNQTLNVKFIDESRASFQYAFYVTSEVNGAMAIFTEHCGYFVVPGSTDVSYATPAD